MEVERCVITSFCAQVSYGSESLLSLFMVNGLRIVHPRFHY